jgi:hypothetical protein
MVMVAAETDVPKYGMVRDSAGSMLPDNVRAAIDSAGKLEVLSVSDSSAGYSGIAAAETPVENDARYRRKETLVLNEDQEKDSSTGIFCRPGQPVSDWQLDAVIAEHYKRNSAYQLLDVTPLPAEEQGGTARVYIGKEPDGTVSTSRFSPDAVDKIYFRR